MWNYEIGLSGLDAARKGLDIISNNIANAATEGYHKQSINLIPAYSRETGGLILGGGVSISGVTRAIDKFLELEILNQQSSLSKVSQESDILSSIETAFGELSGDTGLNASINNFFNALNDLSAHPDQAVYQNEVLSAAEEMTARFRSLGNFLTDLDTQLYLQAQSTVDDINSLSTRIAELNDNIQRVEMGGSTAGNLVDQRDELIRQLSEKVDVQTQQREYGVVDVNIGGIPIVAGTDTIMLEAGLNDEGLLGITPAGAYNYQTTVDGGKLGGLLSLYNTTVDDIQSELDSLALSITQQVNQFHCQGVGSDGSFTELSSDTITGGTLGDIVPPVSEGSFFIRVTYTNPVTNEVTVTRHEIAVHTTDTLNDIATRIGAIPELNAFVANNKLTIQGETNCTFDFLPASLSSPSDSDFTDSSPPDAAVSGIYTGTENQTYTFTVAGTGSVGNGTLRLEVRDGNGQLVDNLNIGEGYAAGSQLDFGSGIKISLGTGDVNDGDSFTVEAYADTDTSGFLASAGLNSFFTGHGASDMNISANVADSPGRIATALGADLTDNTNALRLASISDQEVDDLDSLTAGEFYRKLVANIGQQLSVKQTTQTSSENLMQTLTNQQSDISGVDINEEAAQMLVYEQMFQAMAKYLNTINTTLTTLMNLVQ